MTTKRRKPLLDRLQQGLEEGIAHVQGALTLRTVEVPEEPPEIDGETLAALRTFAEDGDRVCRPPKAISRKKKSRNGSH